MHVSTCYVVRRAAWGMTAPLRENGIFDMMGSR